jgi:hypothetical protein
MKSFIKILPAIILVLLISQLNGFSAAKDTIRRFAMIAGANDGGPKRVKLQYAVSDASSVMKVLSEMGGISQEDSLLLIDPDRKKFIFGLRLIQEKINQARSETGRCEFILYYSGHSDDESILLGKEKISYKEIRDYVNSIPAEVRIAILDSCSSGAFARLKGGKMRTPFMVDSSFNMKGYAFMTSSSADEASQESERIKGSFFTHYLTSGLRGAADMNQDGRITLSEAYQFAYSETLSVTEKTLSGPQHPNYNIQMSGTGDVVMTDIRKSSALMIISDNISGSLFIRDNNRNLVCELRKPAGRSIQFGLDYGNYSLINIREGQLFEAEVYLSKGGQLNITQDNFRMTDKEHATARGDIGTAEIPVSDNTGKKIDESYTVVPWNFSPFPMVWMNSRTIHYFSINLFGSYCGKLDGISIGLGPGIVREDFRGLQLNLIGNYTGANGEGIQGSIVANITRQKMSGLQISNIFNYCGSDVKGAQVTSIFNYSKGNTQGAQIATIFNISRKNTRGAQVSSIFNYTGENYNGGQVSGIFNFAGDVSGAQIAGITNISDDLKGTQVSLLNIAGNSKGIQLGLINIAREQEGIPIGLINVSGNGSIDLAVWGSNLMAANAGIIFRANHVYSILSAGWINLDRKVNKSFACGFHLGGHFPINSFYIDADLGIIAIDNEKKNSDPENTYRDNQALEARIIAGYNITDRIAAFAGGGADYIYECRLNKYENRFKHGKYSPLFLAGVKFSIFGGKP